MANSRNKRFQRVSYQSKIMRVYADLVEWRQIYGRGPGPNASRSLQALYAARAVQCRDMCMQLDLVLHIMRMFV